MNLKYILIIVILTAFVGGGILTYQYWWMPRQEIKSPKVKPPEEVTTDETVDWKTARATRFGFSISHPSNWIVKFSQNGDGFTLYPFQNSEDGVILYGWFNPSADVEGGPLTLEEYTQQIISFYQKDYKDYNLLDKEEISAAGKEAYKLTSTFTEDNLVKKEIHIVMAGGSVRRNIILRTSLENFDIYLPIFQKMLNTYQVFQGEDLKTTW